MPSVDSCAVDHSSAFPFTVTGTNKEGRQALADLVVTFYEDAPR